MDKISHDSLRFHRSSTVALVKLSIFVFSKLNLCERANRALEVSDVLARVSQRCSGLVIVQKWRKDVDWWRIKRENRLFPKTLSATNIGKGGFCVGNSVIQFRTLPGRTSSNPGPSPDTPQKGHRCWQLWLRPLLRTTRPFNWVSSED